MKDPIYAAQATEIAALCAENAELSRKLEILKEHGIEIVDAVAGGFEIYSEDYARASKLKAENAKLRELANIGKLTAEHCTEMEGTVVALKAENAKLRELFTDLALDHLYSCGYRTQRHDGFPRHTCAEYEDLLDEIGIEV